MKFACQVATIVLAFFAFNQLAIAQDLPPGGIDPGTINNGGGGQDGQVLNNGGTAENAAGEFNADNIGPEIPEIEDTRRQNGFIGRNAAAIAEQGYVGPTAEGISGQTQNAGGGGVNRPGGGGGAASGLSFTVSRSNVRARVRPNFSYRAIPTTVIQSNFQRRVQKLPNLRNAAPQKIEVSIEGTTATLTGQASNQESIDKMVGQLRMEPGVYRIINQVEIQAQNQVGQNQPARK